MNIRPFRTLFIIGGSVLILSGVLLHIIERSARANLTLYDGPWFIAITQLTIGYGEISPLTDIGKGIAVGPGLLGMFTLSMVVTYISRELELSRDEKELTELLSHQNYIRTTLRPLVVVFLQRWWRLKLSRRGSDPLRLKKLFDYKLIHDKFKAQFAIDLVGGTPELRKQIVAFRKNTKREFGEMKKKLQAMPEIHHEAGILSTQSFNQITKVLKCRQAFLRCIGMRKKKVHSRSPSTMVRKKRSKRSTILEKRATDIALRKVKARITLLHPVSLHEVVENSHPDSPDSSIDLSSRPAHRRVSYG